MLAAKEKAARFPVPWGDPSSGPHRSLLRCLQLEFNFLASERCRHRVERVIETNIPYKPMVTKVISPSQQIASWTISRLVRISTAALWISCIPANGAVPEFVKQLSDE